MSLSRASEANSSASSRRQRWRRQMKRMTSSMTGSCSRKSAAASVEARDMAPSSVLYRMSEPDCGGGLRAGQLAMLQCSPHSGAVEREVELRPREGGAVLALAAGVGVFGAPSAASQTQSAASSPSSTDLLTPLVEAVGTWRPVEGRLCGGFAYGEYAAGENRP